MSAPSQFRLSFAQRFGYSLGNLPAELLWNLILGWGMYFLSPPPDKVGATFYLPATLAGMVIGLGRILNGISDPLTGYVSDRTKTRWGRRMPFILLASPPFLLSFLLFWFPPVPAAVGGQVYTWSFFGRMIELNSNYLPTAIWLFIFGGGFYFLFAVVINPYLSLLPEIAPENDERLNISMWQAYLGVVATILAMGLVGYLITELPQGITVAGFHLKDMYKVIAIGSVVLSAACLAPTLLLLKETRHTEKKEVPYSMLRAWWETLRNRAFLPWVVSVSLLRLAADIVISSIPFLMMYLLFNTSLADKSELLAGGVQLTIMVVAAAMFPLTNWLSSKFGKRSVFLLCLLWFGLFLPVWATLHLWGPIPPVYRPFILFLLAAPPVSAMLVLPRPILADIIDYDETVTGFRRESVYNGVEGLWTKSFSALSPLILGLMFDLLGRTHDRPLGIILVGPVAGLITLLSFAAFRFYPLKK